LVVVIFTVLKNLFVAIVCS